MSQAERDEFFIGWLRMPAGHARLSRRAALAMLGLGAGSAAVLAARQRSPGPAAWDDASRTLVGVVSTRPYAMLRTAGERPGAAPRMVLLVEEGKFGAAQRVAPREGQAVRVRGTLLRRDARWMMELASDPQAIEPIAEGAAGILQQLAWPAPLPRGRVALRGEIIDPKCYLGAMKPGGGKTHKACATLCISGGIPPMLVARDDERRELFYLLAAGDGSPINEAILPFVGDAVQLAGQLVVLGDLPILRVDLASLRRL
jgi:hypothetical protein